jgi:hypothetical protein
VKWPVIAAFGFLGMALASRLAGAGTGGRRRERYPPQSPEARALFREAAVLVGLPPSWADEEGLHEILDKESKGWVGVPNYTYDDVLGLDVSDPANRSVWPRVWDELRRGEVTAGSTATGLGQLTQGNVDEFYPGGRAGIGDPLAEAAGMLRYIADQYNTPAQAWASYQLPPCCGSRLHRNRIRRGRGDSCVDGPHRGHINWLDSGCKTHEGY